jgi:hypothetical protein
VHSSNVGGSIKTLENRLFNFVAYRDTPEIISFRRGSPGGGFSWKWWIRTLTTSRCARSNFDARDVFHNNFDWKMQESSWEIGLCDRSSKSNSSQYFLKMNSFPFAMWTETSRAAEKDMPRSPRLAEDHDFQEELILKLSINMRLLGSYTRGGVWGVRMKYDRESWKLRKEDRRIEGAKTRRKESAGVKPRSHDSHLPSHASLLGHSPLSALWLLRNYLRGSLTLSKASRRSWDHTNCVMWWASHLSENLHKTFTNPHLTNNILLCNFRPTQRYRKRG